MSPCPTSSTLTNPGLPGFSRFWGSESDGFAAVSKTVAVGPGFFRGARTLSRGKFLLGVSLKTFPRESFSRSLDLRATGILIRIAREGSAMTRTQ